jgi:hypothetical protein
MKKIAILTVNFLAFLSVINSQQRFDFNAFNGSGELRTIYMQKHRISENYTINLDAGSYIGIGSNVWTRWGFRGLLQRRVSDISQVDIGFMYNRIHFNAPIADTDPAELREVTKHEYRPHQSLNVNYPRFKSSTLQHRLRLEERIFSTSDNPERDFRMRLRYRVLHQGRFDGQPIAPKSLFYRTSAEFNFNLYQEAKDVFWIRGRYCFGLGYQFNSRLSTDVNYNFEHNKSEKGNSYTIIHIFQLTLRQTIYWI